MSDESEMLDLLFDLGATDIHEAKRTTTQKAPFGWVGGKSESLKHLLPIIKERLCGKWIETFGGSGIISWNIPDQNLMVFNDAYSGVHDFYKVLQSKQYKELEDRLALITPPLSREEWQRARATWCEETDPIERAAKWFYMYKCSVIQKGQSFARATNSKPPINIPNALKLFTPVHWKLQGFQLENLDFRTCIRDYASVNALFVHDPPYLSADSGIYAKKWSIRDQKDLLTLIEESEGTHLLCGYDCHLNNDAMQWDDKLTWKVSLTSEAQAFTAENNKKGGEGRSMGYADEVLWIKENH